MNTICIFPMFRDNHVPFQLSLQLHSITLMLKSSVNSLRTKTLTSKIYVSYIIRVQVLLGPRQVFNVYQLNQQKNESYMFVSSRNPSRTFYPSFLIIRNLFCSFIWHLCVNSSPICVCYSDQSYYLSYKPSWMSRKQLKFTHLNYIHNF